MQPGSQNGIVLETKDIRADHETLKVRGMAISKIESAPWGTFATLTDPDGNGWVLQQTTLSSAGMKTVAAKFAATVFIFYP